MYTHTPFSYKLRILPALPFRFLNSSALVLLGCEVSDMSAATIHNNMDHKRLNIILTNQILCWLYETLCLFSKLVLMTNECSWSWFQLTWSRLLLKLKRKENGVTGGIRLHVLAHLSKSSEVLPGTDKTTLFTYPFLYTIGVKQCS